MQWQELACVIGRGDAEALSDAMMECGALSVRFEASNEQPLFREKLNDDVLWDETKVIGLFSEGDSLAQVEAQIKKTHSEWSVIQFCREVIADRDWVRLTQEQFTPQLVSNMLWVCPTGHEIDDGKCVLKIDPGLAFGTGTHPTTQLCLQWLCEHDMKMQTIIDYGCGSGILSVAALILGAKKVYALDHDDQALLATCNNAKLNDIDLHEDLIVQIDDATVPSVPVVIANILASPLKTLINRFVSILESQGQLVMSGLLVSDVEGIRSIYSREFKEMECVDMDGWVRMTWSKK